MRPLAHAAAAAATLAAFALKVGLPQVFGPPYILFYPTVVLVGVLGGLGPGLLATALAAFLSAGWVLPAAGSAPGGAVQEAVGLCIFTASGVLVSVLAQRYRALRGTDLRRADEELRRSEARFRALTERASDMVAVFGRNGEILYWSPSATEQLGWSAEELRARTAAALAHPDDAARVAAAFAALLDAPGTTGQVTARFRHRDGSWRRLDTVARNLVEDPDVGGVVANARDVTEQVLLEEQLRQAQRLESIGRLAGGVAHDFNNLLTVILSGAGQLKQDLAEGRHLSAEEVEEIQAAGERGRDLTRQLLAFARKQVIAPTTLDLDAVVRGSQKLLRRLLGEDVKLLVELQPGLWPVLADPGQLEQVILNLAVNARDAMPDGGQLTLRTRNAPAPAPVPGGAAPEGDQVVLSVHDSGTGMSPEVQAHLFEPFFTTKRVGQGTGLGLATVHGIVTQSGGRLRVESAVGQGSTFEIRLPRAAAAAAVAAPVAPAPAEAGSETVLVAEDDPQVRGIVQRVLTGAGYRVLAAPSGTEALELAQRHAGRIALLLSDVVMPGLSGRGLAAELQARRPGTRVLFVSGYPQGGVEQHGPLAPGQALLAKPFTTNTLLQAVRRALDEVAPAEAAARFAWQPALEIGDPLIDEQHRSLFDAAARFEAAVLGGESAFRLEALFDFLAVYADTHFRDEEALLWAREVPGLVAHRQEHAAFLERLKVLRSRLGAGAPSASSSAVLFEFLQTWLVRHIGGSDQALRPAGRPAGAEAPVGPA